MLGRELAIALRSPLTWLQAALSALLVGHGFVLAIDLYAAGSRSVRASALMAREFDPLLGLVRPTLGGLYLSLSLLGPIVAARVLSVERERRTLAALLLQTGAPVRLLFAKLIAAVAGMALQLVAPLVMLVVWRFAGGHLALGETVVSLLGYGLYLFLIAAIALAAAAWTRTLAQAATVGLLIVVISWAIDASEGFAALSWLGSALDWSTSTHLAPFERGILALGDLAWLLLLAMGAVGAAWVGVRFDLSPRRRVGILAVVLAGAALACSFVRKDQHGVDLTEGQRASLPPGVIRALRALPLQLTLEVWLDRDDARRRQLESDALAKLRLARPDLVVRWPTDTRQSPAESERELGYGRIVVRANRHARETYSTSRRELVALIFEAAGEPPPDFTQHEYPGFPMVIEGKRRSLIASTAYFGVPSGLLVLGWFCTQPGRRKT